MKPTRLVDIDDALIEFNRTRYKNELAQGIYELMVKQCISKTELATLLDIHKSRISHVLSGARNLSADTLADILLVLGRTPHLVLATDFEAIRFPVDEGEADQSSMSTPSAEETFEGSTDGEGFIRIQKSIIKNDEQIVPIYLPTGGRSWGGGEYVVETEHTGPSVGSQSNRRSTRRHLVRRNQGLLSP